MVLLTLISGFFLVALLYASVGHGGATGYLALMTLLSFAPESMRPTALCLNIIVSGIASFRFYRSGHFRRELLLPFVVASVPLAWLGGSIRLTGFETQFKWILGFCLIVAIIRILFEKGDHPDRDLKNPPTALALLLGGAIGFIAGLIGIGGGVLLSPVLLLAGWSTVKQASAVAAPFILFNSLAGILAAPSDLLMVDRLFPFIAVAVVAGAWLGSDLGSRVLNPRVVRIFLSIVLSLAVVKLFI